MLYRVQHSAFREALNLMKEIEHLELSDAEEIVLTIGGSEDCCHCEFAVAELWKAGRFIRRLDGATRKTMNGEIGDERLLDFYYDPDKMSLDSMLRIIERWKTEWLAYGISHGIRVRVNEELQAAENQLTQQ